MASGAAIRTDTVGVLGGMGPLATIDFCQKVIALTQSNGDADHIPLIISSFPQIPDRVAPVLTGHGISPLPALRRERDFLRGAGAKCLVMPCNTAHFWYDDLAKDAGVPFLHIVESAADALAGSGVSAKGTVGIIATKATLKAKMFQQRLKARGYASITPDTVSMDGEVVPAIRHVKQNQIKMARGLFRQAIQRLLNAGAQRVILACTEVPPTFAPGDPLISDYCIDATEALAQAAVNWAMAHRGLTKTIIG
ncbi:MAG: cysteate racemase [Rhodospirillales bacterium]|jgi:aspartate racemase